MKALMEWLFDLTPEQKLWALAIIVVGPFVGIAIIVEAYTAWH